MLLEDEKLASEVSQLAAGACVALFDAYGVELRPAAIDWTVSDERRICGVIGFVGRYVRGSCLLAASLEPIDSSCPSGGRVRDWVGELANQLAGRLKTKLLSRGVEVALTTPIVLSGVKLEPLPRGRLEPICFAARSGAVLVWVEIDADRAFELGPERSGQSGDEGEVLLF